MTEPTVVIEPLDPPRVRKGSNFPVPGEGEKLRSRRILPVPVGHGECPFTEPTMAVRRWQRDRCATTRRLLTYSLASRLSASWMEASVTKVSRVVARFSKSLASRRLRPNQEKVRSTTQRRGKTTKPYTSSFRLTISIRSNGNLATAVSICRAL